MKTFLTPLAKTIADLPDGPPPHLSPLKHLQDQQIETDEHRNSSDELPTVKDEQDDLASESLEKTASGGAQDSINLGESQVSEDTAEPFEHQSDPVQWSNKNMSEFQAPSQLIAVEQLSKKYSTAIQDEWALQNVSLSINSGEMVAIRGTSGSGKTTLLNIIGGLDHHFLMEKFISTGKVVLA